MALNSITMVPHCAVTLQILPIFAMIPIVEFVELPGEDLIPQGLAVMPGKDLAKASTLPQTHQRLMTMQKEIDLELEESQPGTLDTMQLFCVMLLLV